MKYVIKNCDNYTDLDKDWTCRSTIQNRKGCYRCIDCTDCLLKRIVNEVKWEIQAEPDYNNRTDLAERILDMFEIEECE